MQNVYDFLIFCGNSGYANASQCYTYIARFVPWCV